MMIDAFDTTDALAMREAMRQRIAARAATPWWYPPLYGLGCGGIVASIALPLPVIPLGAIACCAMLTACYTIWTRRSGLSVNGYRRGRTLPITIAVLAAFVLLALAAMLLRFQAEIGWAPLACGAVCALIAGFGSAAWDRAWRADILSAA